MSEEIKIIKEIIREGYITVNGKTHKEIRDLITKLEGDGLVICTRSRFSGDHIGFIARPTKTLIEKVRKGEL